MESVAGVIPESQTAGPRNKALNSGGGMSGNEVDHRHPKILSAGATLLHGDRPLCSPVAESHERC